MGSGKFEIDPNRVFERLKGNLSHTAELVAYGLCLRPTDPADLRLPGSLLQFGARPADVVGEAFQPWILNVGLRRYIEVLHHFLVDVGFMSEVYRNDSMIPARTQAEAALLRWRRMHLPGKLDTIEANIGEPLPHAVRRDLLTINTARTIFEHDGGLVTHARARSDEFVLSFRGLDMAVRTVEATTQVTTLPISMPSNASFEVSVEARERRFAVGDVLTLSAADFVDIGVSLMHAGTEIMLSLPPYHSQRDERPDPSQPQKFAWSARPGQSQFQLPCRLY